MGNNKNECLGGFQMPLITRQKIEAYMEAVRLVKEDREVFFNGARTEVAESVVQHLDAGRLFEAGQQIVSAIEETLLRKLVRGKLREIVRKKKGGGGFVLYSPNQGKKKPPKPVADFPTKLQAKRAELQRFPPKDVAKLKRLRGEVDKLVKDPKKAKEKESEWAGKKKDGATKKRDDIATAKAAAKKESLQLIQSLVEGVLKEALFKEEEDGTSKWDERMAKLSRAALEADKKLQGLQKNIEKKAETVLTSAFSVIQKALKPRKMQTKSSGVKKDPNKQKTFLQFSVVIETSDVGPFYIYVDGNRPKIEMSDEAKQKLMKVLPETAKLLRAELITVQEDTLDQMTDVSAAVAKRDGYLDKLESKVDGFVAGLNGTEVSVLKSLLVNKYRGK